MKVYLLETLNIHGRIQTNVAISYFVLLIWHKNWHQRKGYKMKKWMEIFWEYDSVQ